MKDLSAEAVNSLRRNARSMVRELGLLNDAYFEIGVTLAERHILIELEGNPAITMGEMAERLLVDKSTISRLISKALKKGFIECISDAKDKRKRILQMTELGKQTLEAFEPIAFKQTEQALLTLAPDDIDKVYTGIALYAKGLRNSRTQAKEPKSAMEFLKIENLAEISSLLNQKGYALRLFQSNDEQELYKIFQEVVDSGVQFPYEFSTREEFQRQFFPPKGQVYVCHTLDEKVIGGFYIKSNCSGRSRHIANAAYMIHSMHRNKGIGSLLIKASLQFAKQLGHQAMQFNMVLSQNTHAVKLYMKLGFSIVGNIPEAIRNPDGSYQAGYVMYRKLNNLN